MFMLSFFLPVQRMYVVSSRQLKRIDGTSRSFIYTNFSEAVVGSDSVRAYAKQIQFIEQCDDLVDKNNMAYYASICLRRWVVYGITLECYKLMIHCQDKLPGSTIIIYC